MGASALHAHAQLGWGWAQVVRFTFAFSRMTSLSRRSLRFLSAFCIFSRRSTGLTGGGVAYRRSRRDGESIEIRGDGLTLGPSRDVFSPVAAPTTSESRIGIKLRTQRLLREIMGAP